MSARPGGVVSFCANGTRHNGQASGEEQDVAEWSDFFVAQAGASAALAGLIFVGLSINLDRIVHYPHMLYRAGAALVVLLSILVISSLMLAPQDSMRAYGLEALGAGAIAWLVTTWLTFRGMRETPGEFRSRARDALIRVQFSTVPMVIAGIVILSSGSNGLYWLLAGFLAGFIVAIAEGWVLLVEIHR
jgi:hypothetical protein